MKYEYYIPVVVVALVVLLLGCMNPVCLQSKKGASAGNPNYVLVALVSLLAGVAATYGVCAYMKNKRVSLVE